MPESTTDSIHLKVPRLILIPVDVKSECAQLVYSQGSKAQAKNPGGSSIAVNKLARDRKPPERLAYEIQVSKGSQIWDGLWPVAQDHPRIMRELRTVNTCA